jgi:hypothetical protein
MINKTVSMTLSVAGAASRFAMNGLKNATVAVRIGEQIV